MPDTSDKTLFPYLLLPAPPTEACGLFRKARTDLCSSLSWMLPEASHMSSSRISWICRSYEHRYHQRLNTSCLITVKPDQVLEIAEISSQNLCQWTANGCRQVMAAQTGNGSSAPPAASLLSQIKAKGCSEEPSQFLAFAFFFFLPMSASPHLPLINAA